MGFRTPLLAHNPPVRQALAKAGFLYDSSIPEVWPGASSPNATARLFPYTMDYGIPQVCSCGFTAWTGSRGSGGGGGEHSCNGHVFAISTLAAAASLLQMFPSLTSSLARSALQNCAYFQGARCEESERYPGLWQVPLLEMEQPGGELVAVMDPGQQAEGGLGYGANVTEAGLSADALEELLRTNFDFRWGWRVVGCGWRG